jgi:hypothetical protein
VFVSTDIIAQTRHNSWFELLTFVLPFKQIGRFSQWRLPFSYDVSNPAQNSTAGRVILRLAGDVSAKRFSEHSDTWSQRKPLL